MGTGTAQTTTGPEGLQVHVVNTISKKNQRVLTLELKFYLIGQVFSQRISVSWLVN